jgi:hypothetical protein
MEKQKNTGYKTLVITLIVISIALIIFSFFAPSIFLKEASSKNLDFTKTGNIGDTIGGLMNPFIAIAGVMVTFLAFYIQYKFNEFQIDLFRTELKNTENKYDKDKFENQFYEMLRLHKENVNEIYIKTRKRTNPIDPNSEIVENTVYGRSAFEYLIYELSIIYIVTIYSFKKENLTSKQHLNEAYGMFFHGLEINDLKKHIFFQNLDELQRAIESLDYERFEIELEKHVKLTNGKKVSRKLDFEIFNGRAHQLAHYYRHLYQTVKFVVNQNENILKYEEKRNYLRILRAQLSNTEQVLLFYNWYSDFGRQWENDTNKFFTDYRMIHNLYDDILITDFKLESIFNINSGYKKEKNRDSDNLFEFQDW